MQMYRGLDIVTNKVTASEQASVPHHCLGFVSPMEKLDVSDYQDIGILYVINIYFISI